MVVSLLSLLLVAGTSSGWSLSRTNGAFHQRRPTWALGAQSKKFSVCDHEAVISTSPATRRDCLISASTLGLLLQPRLAEAKCTDVDSCREIGERREEEIMKARPIVRLGNGLVYRVLESGYGTETVAEDGKADIAFAIYQGNGSYMYSKGMGFNTVNVGNQRTADVGSVDSLLVTLGSKDLPIGVQQAMIGMHKGEKRRINCPSVLGFETSDWNPQPVDFRGRQQIIDYKSRLYGRGDTQPPFPAPTIWEVEILRIPKK